MNPAGVSMRWPRAGDDVSTGRWRRLLPREHGGWAFTLEPLLLGLVAAPSAAGAWLAVAAGVAFLARRPLKLAGESGDAIRVVVGLGLIGMVALGVAGWLGGVSGLMPLLAAVPAGGVFLWHDGRGAAREGVAEVAGAAAFSILPAALAACAGWPVERAFALAGLMLARSLPTVLTVRAYVRDRKGRPEGRGLAWMAAVGAVVLAAVLAGAGLAPAMGVMLGVALTIRTGWLLGPWAPDISAKRVGMVECAIGVVYAIVLGVVW